MKIEFLFIAVFVYMTLSCAKETAKPQEAPVTPFKNKRVVTFQIDNANETGIGFEYYSDDQSPSIKSVLLYGQSVYLLDTYHNNVKKLGLQSEKLAASKKLGGFVLLSDITAVNGQIVVVGDRDKGYVLSPGLEVKDSITLPMDLKFFKKPVGDTVFYSTSSRYGGGTLHFFDLNTLTYLGKRETKVDTRETIRGKLYQTKKENGEIILSNEFGNYSLDREIPSLSKYYDATNLDFDDKTIVFFDANPEAFTLYMYEY